MADLTAANLTSADLMALATRAWLTTRERDAIVAGANAMDACDRLRIALETGQRAYRALKEARAEEFDAKLAAARLEADNLRNKLREWETADPDRGLPTLRDLRGSMAEPTELAATQAKYDVLVRQWAEDTTEIEDLIEKAAASVGVVRLDAEFREPITDIVDRVVAVAVGERKAKELALAGLESNVALYDAQKHELRAAQARIAELEAACRTLIDAPHYEHFATRLNDAEMKGIITIKAALLAAKPGGG